jgi:hypothetical protein
VIAIEPNRHSAGCQTCDGAVDVLDVRFAPPAPTSNGGMAVHLCAACRRDAADKLTASVRPATPAPLTRAWARYRDGVFVGIFEGPTDPRTTHDPGPGFEFRPLVEASTPAPLTVGALIEIADDIEAGLREVDARQSYRNGVARAAFATAAMRLRGLAWAISFRRLP